MKTLRIVFPVTLIMFAISLVVIACTSAPAQSQTRNGTIVYQNEWSRVVHIEGSRRSCYLAEKKVSVSGPWVAVNLECL